MNKFELLAATSMALLSATPVFAQDAPPPAPAPVAAAPAPQTSQYTPAEGDIVITAQRQSERLQDVPIAVSAFNAAALDRQQITNPTALQQSLPSITFTKTNFTSSSFTIRGIGDLCTGTACDSATAIHINDMPLVSTRLFESEFYDLERVEVLRGPQGTLFGRNATSGVVNFITAKPDLSGIHAAGEFEYGNFDSKQAKAMFNLPLGKTLGVRVAGLWLNRDGFTKNLYDNSRIDGRDLYSIRGTISWEPDSNTRVDLMGYYFHEKDDRSRIQKQLCHRDPTGVLGCLPDRLGNDATNWNSTLGALLSSSQFLKLSTASALAGALADPRLTDAQRAQLAQAAPGIINQYGSFGLGSIYGTDALAGAINPTDLRTTDVDYNPTYFAEEKQFQAKIMHDFGPVTLNLIGGYAENEVDSRTDYSNSVESALTNNVGLATLYATSQAPGALFPGGVNPFAAVVQKLIPNGPNGGLCQSDLTSNDGGVYSGASLGCFPQSLDPDRSLAKYKQWSAEAHLDSHFSGPFNFLLGGIYLDQRINQNNYMISNFGLDYISGLLGSIPRYLGAVPASVTAGTPFYNNNEEEYRLKSYGIFGEGYLNIGDKAKLTVGLRYNHDDKFLRARTTLLFDSNNVTPYLPYGATNIGDSLNAAGLDYDGHVDGNQDFARDSASFSRMTGRAVLDYKITPDNLLYFSYSRGYKSGGINPPLSPTFQVPTTFKPEQVDAFEIGSKNTFMGGALRLNVTGFYYKYKDLQLARIVSRTAVNDNINANIYGLEVEAVIAPTRDFLVNTNFSWLHTKVTSDEQLPNPHDPSGGRSDAVIIKDLLGGANCAVLSNVGSQAAAAGFVQSVNTAIGTSVGDPTMFNRPGTASSLTPVLSNGTLGAYSVCSQLQSAAASPAAAAIGGITFVPTGVPVSILGNKLPQAPAYKFAIGAQYTIRFGGDVTLVPRVDLNYTGNSYASIFNQNIDRMPGYEVVNAQIQLNGPSDAWYVRAFVKNLTKNDGITGQYVTDQSTGLFTNVFTIEPRRFGVAAGFKF